MPLNFTVVDDPRTAYRPRQVDGLTAYWNANRGQMVDYQTGGALADRVAAMRSQQGPNPNAYVYGDSYGQIQGVEESRQRAAEQRAMQLYAMQQAAAERAQALRFSRQDAAFNQNLRLADLQRLRENSQAANDMAAARLQLAYDAETGRNDRSQNSIGAKLAQEQMRQQAKINQGLSNLSADGQSIADEWSSALSRYNDLKGTLDTFQTGYEQNAAEIAPWVSSNRLVGTGFGYAPANPQDKEAAAIAEKANQFAQARQSAKATAAELAGVVKDMDKIQSYIRDGGFQFDQRTGKLTNSNLPQAAWQVNSPMTLQPRQRRPMTEEEYQATLPDYVPAVAKPPTSVAKLGGRYIRSY